jgi:hypothetical protein
MVLWVSMSWMMVGEGGEGREMEVNKDRVFGGAKGSVHSAGRDSRGKEQRWVMLRYA